jgi:cytidylate kinase
MAVITLSRQVGSGGDEIAEGVARRLALRLVGSEIINQAARQAGTPEVALAALDELGLLGVKPSRDDRERYAATVAEIIRGLADNGNVLLLGRGGQVVLQERPDVLHVRVIAPFPWRARRVAEQYQLPEGAAATQLQARDQARAAYVQQYHGRSADDPELYAMILNTSRLDPATAVEAICRAAIQLPTWQPKERS